MKIFYLIFSLNQDLNLYVWESRYVYGRDFQESYFSLMFEKVKV